MECCARRLASDGFTLGVSEDFIDHVEKIELAKTDDSVDNCVEGFVQDVTNVLSIPVVVKQEN